jgi:ribonuclease R
MQLLHERHLGDEFSGVVTGITGSGLYVQLERFLVEGMVRLQDMPQSGGRPDEWRADDRTGRLVAKRSGASLGIGDIVMVEIQRVDLGSRHLDLRLTELPRQPERPPGDRPPDKRKEKRKGKGGYKQGRRGRRSR